MLLLGLLLVVASGGGFWYVLQSFDDRQEYLVSARTIERWEIATAADFTVVEANVARRLRCPWTGWVSWSASGPPAGSRRERS